MNLPLKAVPKVKSFMTPRVLTVSPDMDIFAAIHFLLDHKISGAPVVESPGSMKVVGMLSELECMRVLANGAFYGQPEGRVGDFMRSDAETVSPETDLFSAASKFLHTGCRRMAVVEDGQLVGLISRSDVLRASRHMWDAKNAVPVEASHYMSDRLKAHMGSSAVAHVHKTSA